MRVCIVSAIYPPEPLVSARTSAQLARWLAARGHAVTVITNFPNRPQGMLYQGFRRRWRAAGEDGAGVRLVRCFSTLSARSTLASRLAENLSFGLSSAWALLREPRPDVIYANSWPIFASALLTLVAGWRRVPVVVSVQDVYPDSLASQERLTVRSPGYRLLERIDTWVARRAAALVTITPRFKRLYVERRRLPAGSIHVVPNWIDDVEPPEPAAGAAIRSRHGIPSGTFLAVYGGSISTAAGVETLIRALAHTSRDQMLLIAGDGSLRAQCQRLAAAVGGERVRFHYPWPASETAAVYQAADVLLLPTWRNQSLVSLPSKLLGYMAAGKPIIALATAESELAGIIGESGGGWVLPPDDPKLLGATLDDVAEMPATERRAVGAAGRAYLTRHFTAAACLPRVAQVLECAARVA